MSKRKKQVFSAIQVMLAVVLMLGAFVATSGDLSASTLDQFTPGNSLIDEATSRGGGRGADEIITEIDEQVRNLVGIVRALAIIGAIVFILWTGIVLFTSGGDPRKLATLKTSITLFFISMILFFSSEAVVRLIVSWFHRN